MSDLGRIQPALLWRALTPLQRQAALALADAGREVLADDDACCAALLARRIRPSQVHNLGTARDAWEAVKQAARLILDEPDSEFLKA